MIRALDEFEIDGIATTIPADLAILRHPDFVAGEHSTKWVEDRLDLSAVGAVAAAPATDADGEPPEPKVRRDVDVEVNGRRFGVTVWVPESPGRRRGGRRRGRRQGLAPRPGARPAPRPPRPAAATWRCRCRARS